MRQANVTVMGIFALDVAFRTPRLPVWGETVVGSGLQIGPGGKGSNQAEAEALTGKPAATPEEAEAAADELLRRGAGHAVITLGARGVLVKSATMTQHIAAFDVGRVVDTTGAGDAFNAGFAVGLAEGTELVTAARFGCAVAGISVTRHGTSSSMPGREDVDALLRRE